MDDPRNTWRSGGDREPVSGTANLGLCNLKLAFPDGKDVDPNHQMLGIPLGVVAEGLGDPISPDEAFGTPPGWFTAQVDEESGVLRVPDPPAEPPATTLRDWYFVFGQPGSMGYHVCDYCFFWGNIRHNVAVRVGAFLARPRM